MPFTFRLESVLKYRQRIVDSKGREVSVAQAALAAVGVRLRELENEIQRQLEGAPGYDLRVQDMVAKTAWLEFLDTRRQELQGEMERAQAALAAARQELNAAWRDLEVLKQLKRRRKSEWMREMETLERKELDEIGQIRADRARRSELATRGEQLAPGEDEACTLVTAAI